MEDHRDHHAGYDSRLQLAAAAFVAIVLASRIIVPLAALFRLIYRRVRRRQVTPAPVGGRFTRLAWWLSGALAALVITSPFVVLVSLIGAGGRVYELPSGAYVALSMLALAAVVGASLVPLTALAWREPGASGVGSTSPR